MKKKEDLAIKNLREINSLDKIFSQTCEMLHALLDILRQKKAEFDSINKKIEELDRVRISFSRSKTGTGFDKFFESAEDLIIRLYTERYALLQKEKDSVIGSAREIRYRIQDFVRVLDEVYYWIHDYYTGQNTASKIYTKIFQS